MRIYVVLQGKLQSHFILKCVGWAQSSSSKLNITMTSKTNLQRNKKKNTQDKQYTPLAANQARCANRNYQVCDRCPMEQHTHY